MLGRSKAFWKPIYEELRCKLDGLKDVDLDEFYNGINSSAPSLIRVEADELTYSLHIMVRYEIEKMLIEGSVEVSELPSLWNDKMEEYLGIIPKDDSEGVLQDVHWSWPTPKRYPVLGVETVGIKIKYIFLFKSLLMMQNKLAASKVS